MLPLVITLLILTAFIVASWFCLPRWWARAITAIGARTAGFRQKDIEVDGVSWHYLEGGRGPTVVLVHGLAAEGSHWLMTATRLRKHFHVLMPDLPGFGESQAASDVDFHIEAQAARLGRWLDTLNVESCLIAGNSMGGWIAAEYAAQNPGRVKALWLQDPLGVSSARRSELLTLLYRDNKNLFVINGLTDYRNLMAHMFVKPPWIPYPVMWSGCEKAQTLVPEMDRLQREVLQESHPLEELAERLRLPVLIQWGDKDRAVDVSGMPILQDLLPDVKADLLKDTGHIPMLECPARSTRAFLEFVQGINHEQDPSN